MKGGKLIDLHIKPSQKMYVFRVARDDHRHYNIRWMQFGRKSFMEMNQRQVLCRGADKG